MTALLTIDKLSKRFERKPDAIERLAAKLGANIRGISVKAVDQASFTVQRGEVVGLVGESGCGKSTLGRMVAGLLPPSDGRIIYDGADITHAGTASGKRLGIQMIFQDPMSSLNPRMAVRDIIGEAAVHHGIISRADMPAYVAGLLQQVGLDPSYAGRYPHQFSGGQRQRIGIARALAVKPDFLICDESIAALDVSIQAQVINLFQDLRRQLGLTYLFISHDLGVVEHIADRVVVMYLGRVVETAPTEALFAAPRHPYTQALLAQIPRIDSGARDFTPIKGEIPSPVNPPSGCHFHPRCPFAGPRCKAEAPRLISQGDHAAACHLIDGGVQ
ncbi:MAG: ATP-binding cassette domain-containing protein [Paracoccus sp. (in: a-proteobacteria)]|uniref:ABC transporter ATP-binding protein n=1 Tax=Paracoccus sp. TaxID=267 RepID=UPI0026DF9045|nr:oligopeptide/dipeptide ABC transporter ATP-binding protein [Paracoccus sp. (in: a-proteobacteria)]MDO5620350.1 ATP-binding cassette domain-containing protein [Paracoccus sp. (in: a-proteobacteria)]